MFRRYFFMLLFTLSSYINTSLALPPNLPSLYAGEPSLNKLPNSITTAKLFIHAPNPHIKVLNYASTEIPSGHPYSQYQISLKKTKDKLTAYQTVEDTKNNARLIGHGIGFGGIFSMQYFKHGDLVNIPHYYKKYQWQEISNLQGQLFPLKVGKSLRFNYHELSQESVNGKVHHDDGQIVYQVIKKMHHYKNAFTTIPGDVYVIRFSKSTQEHPTLMPQNEYYFSEKLGWYVFAKYYFSGRARVQYQLIKWR